MGSPPQPPTPSSFSPFGSFATLHAAAPPGRDGSTADSFPFDGSRDEKQKEGILEIIKISDVVSEKVAQHDETCLAQVADEEEGSAQYLGTLPRPILDFLSVLKGRAEPWYSSPPDPQKLDVQLERVIAVFGNRKFPKHIKENLPATFPNESEGAPPNSSGYSEERRDSKMYALPQTLRAGDGGSSNTGTLVQPLWLDSGATHHVVSDDTILTNLRDPPARMLVKVADGSEHPVTKVGDIQTPNIKITDVYLVPELKMDLVSVRQLAKSKIVTTFFENHAELWLEGTQIGGAIIDDAESLYRLHFLQAPFLQEGGIDIKVGSHCSIAGKDLRISQVGMISCDKFHLPHVHYVPKLGSRFTLASVQLLAGCDYLVMFSGDWCYVKNRNNGSLVGRGHMHDEDGLYHLEYLRIPLVVVDGAN